MPKLLKHRFDLSNSELLDYWINNFRTINNKLRDDPDLLPLFFNSREVCLGHQDFISFPLLTRALSQFNNPSNMVRTAVSQLLLDFLNLSEKYENLRRFFEYFPMANFYVLNVMQVHDMYQDIMFKVAESA